MSPRTRRPIRFLEPENTQPVPLDPDSDSVILIDESGATDASPDASLKTASSP
jgi:two-component system, sensor histidine kinase LadS